jgi:hypothetical protein
MQQVPIGGWGVVEAGGVGEDPVELGDEGYKDLPQS